MIIQFCSSRGTSNGDDDSGSGGCDDDRLVMTLMKS